MSFDYNTELLDLLLKQVLGTRYTSSSFVFGQELPVMSNYHVNTIFSKELTNLTDTVANFEWSAPTNASGGGTYKILNRIYGETNETQYTYIRKYEDIPMSSIPGTNGRGWHPTDNTIKTKLIDAILGKSNFTFEIETNIPNNNTIYSSNSSYKPIIIGGKLLFMGNSKPLDKRIITLKRVYIYEGNFGPVGGLNLDDVSKILLIDPLDKQPLVYNTSINQWEEGFISINYSPIQNLSDFLDVTGGDTLGINGGLFYNSSLQKWEIEYLPTKLINLSDVNFGDIDENWNGIVWDANTNYWVNNEVQPYLSSISDISGVDLQSVSLVQNDGIIYDSTQQLWIPQQVQLPMTLDTLTDVDFSNIMNNHRLSYVENIDIWKTEELGGVVNVLDDIRDVDLTSLKDIEPKWIKKDTIQLDTPIQNSYFGNSVDSFSIYLITGSYKENNQANTDAGKAYIYKIGQSINLYQKMEPSDPKNNSRFGSVVKINENYVLISAPYHNISSNNEGKIYIYDYINTKYGNISGSVYNETSSIIASTGIENNNFGSSMAIYGDYIIVGANQESSTNRKGKCYIFKKENGSWGEKKVFEGPTTGDYNIENKEQFGDLVEINNDFAFVGVPKKYYPNNKGIVYVYKKDEGGVDNFGLIQTLLPSNWVENGYFGKAMANSNEHLFISSPSTDISGIIYYFKYTDKWGINNGGTEKETAIIQPSDGKNNDQFGKSISTTDKMMICGAENSFYAYRNTEMNLWEKRDKIEPDDVNLSDEFAHSLSLYNKTLIIGSWKDGTISNSGSIYVYNLPEMVGGTKFLIYENINNRWRLGELNQNDETVSVVTRLEHIKNVSITFADYPLLSGSSLIYRNDVKTWVPDIISDILTSINIIPDIEINDISNNDILSYSNSSSKWVNKGSEDFDVSLNKINNISYNEILSSTNEGQGLFYNSTTEKWENNNPNLTITTSIKKTKTNERPSEDKDNIYYDISNNYYSMKVKVDSIPPITPEWLQMMLHNTPYIFGHPTKAITNINVVSNSTSITISWDNPIQIATLFDCINEEDKVNDIYYLPAINDIYFEIKKKDESFNEINNLIIGGQNKGQKLYNSSGVEKLTNKIIINSSAAQTLNSDTIEIDNTNQKYNYNSYQLESNVEYKARICLTNSLSVDYEYIILENLKLQ